MFLSEISKPFLPGIFLTVLLVALFEPTSGFCQLQGQEDVSAYVTVVPSNEKSNLDQRTRMMTSTADVTLTNTSERTLLSPLHAVIDTGEAQVSVPGALGGPGIGPYGKYYFDLSGTLPGGRLVQGQQVTFRIQFVRSAETRISYSIRIHSSLQ